MLTNAYVAVGGSEKPKCLGMLTLMWAGEFGMYNYLWTLAIVVGFFKCLTWPTL